TPPDNGSYVAMLWASDKDGGAALDRKTITVANVPPSVGTITTPSSPVIVNTTMTASALFSDPGVLDTHTAVWNWGDGSKSAGPVTESAGSGSAAGMHSYAAVGTFTITLTVSDKDGGQGSATAQVVVVAGTGGFVTGGGWIKSPAGAYPADSSLTGKA